MMQELHSGRRPQDVFVHMGYGHMIKVLWVEGDYASFQLLRPVEAKHNTNIIKLETLSSEFVLLK